MSTLQRGNEAEARVLTALVERDLAVLIPFGEGLPYDLLVDLGRRYLRVQCKCSRLYEGCVQFNSCSTDHGLGRRDYRGRADVFGVYFPPTRDVFIVPVAEAATRSTRLRLEATLNNQKARVHMASEYAIERWTLEALEALAPDDAHARPRSQTSAPSTTARRP
jgi:hypothetical protein